MLSEQVSVHQTNTMQTTFVMHKWAEPSQRS